MDREAIARGRRRQQVVDHLEFEREREALLRDQLEDVVTEQHGPALDERVFATLGDEDVAVLRQAIGGPDDEFEDEEFQIDWEADDDDGEDPVEAELARLQAEIEEEPPPAGRLRALPRGARFPAAPEEAAP